MATIVPTDVNHYTFFGYMGVTCALVLGNFGAAYGTAQSGVGVCSAVTDKPELLFKSIVLLLWRVSLVSMDLSSPFSLTERVSVNLISF